MSTSELVTVAVEGAVQIIRLDRPAEMNAITGEMFEAMSDALVLGEGDGKIRAFLLTGAPGVFT
ncbi:MAG: enoyl-CoA hydratase-related protein, partial [Bauldia sp.]